MLEQITPAPAPTQLRVVDPISPAMAERQRREQHTEQAAMHVYEAKRLPTMPPWYDLPKRSRNRFRNAITIASSSVDMDRVAQECRPVVQMVGEGR